MALSSRSFSRPSETSPASFAAAAFTTKQSYTICAHGVSISFATMTIAKASAGKERKNKACMRMFHHMMLEGTVRVSAAESGPARCPALSRGQSQHPQSAACLPAARRVRQTPGEGGGWWSRGALGWDGMGVSTPVCKGGTRAPQRCDRTHATHPSPHVCTNDLDVLATDTPLATPLADAKSIGKGRYGIGDTGYGVSAICR